MRGVETADKAIIEDLIARIALGERAALTELYDRTSAKLLGVALRILRDRAGAEDVLQESFIKIWHNADRYAANGLSPMTWLITIARNSAIDRKRGRRDTVDYETHAETMSSQEPGPEAAAIAASDAARIRECMDELSEDRRDAIRQVYLDGASYADCARALKIPLNTVRTWLRRGLQSLRECMAR